MTETIRPHLKALTSARFFAAVHVLLFHMNAMKGLGWAPLWLQRFASVGYVAVTFFFLLSGFILVYTYADKPLDLKRFWKARLARLYPLYLLSTILIAPGFIYMVLKLNRAEMDLTWFKHHLGLSGFLVITMTQAWVPQAAMGWNAVSWAVSAEVFFYIVFPILLKGLSHRSNRDLLILGIICWIASLTMTLAYHHFSPDHVLATSDHNLPWINALKFHPLVRLPEFITGLACGFWFLNSEHDSRWANPLLCLGLVWIFIVMGCSQKIPYSVLHTGFLTPAFVAVLCGLALNPTWIGVFEKRFFVRLGESSYALYLFHPMFMAPFLFIAPSQGPALWKSASGLIVAVLVGLALFRWVEEPLRKRLR